MKSNLRLPVVTLIVAFVLAGCSDEVPEAASSASPTTSVSPTPTSTPSPTPTPTIARPVMPAAATKHTNKGAEAFTRHLVLVFNRAYETGDVTQIRELSEKDCASCNRIAKQISGTYEAGDRYRGGQISLKNYGFTGVSPDVKPTSITVVDISELVRTTGSGAPVNVEPQSLGVEVYWDLSWTDAGWLLDAVRTPA